MDRDRNVRQPIREELNIGVCSQIYRQFGKLSIALMHSEPAQYSV